MQGLLSQLSLIILIVLIGKIALATLDSATLAYRRFPWGAVGLTTLAVGAVVLQHLWHPALNTFDNDPHRSGWWRPITSVFMQNSGTFGIAVNIVLLAVFAALAEWLWGRPAMLGLFVAGALAPRYMNVVISAGGISDDKRNWAGSSGATMFLGASIVIFAIVAASAPWGQRLGALLVPLFGLASWFAFKNAHGLVAADGAVFGAVCWIVFHRALQAHRRLKLKPNRGVAWLTARLASTPLPH